MGFREYERRDLKRIAEHWGVGESTVVWVLAHDALKRARSEARDYGEAGIAIAAGLRVLGKRV